jgi:hypothetical protein
MENGNRLKKNKYPQKYDDIDAANVAINELRKQLAIATKQLKKIKGTTEKASSKTRIDKND